MTQRPLYSSINDDGTPMGFLHHPVELPAICPVSIFTPAAFAVQPQQSFGLESFGSQGQQFAVISNSPFLWNNSQPYYSTYYPHTTNASSSQFYPLPMPGYQMYTTMTPFASPLPAYSSSSIPLIPSLQPIEQARSSPPPMATQVPALTSLESSRSCDPTRDSDSSVSEAATKQQSSSLTRCRDREPILYCDVCAGTAHFRKTSGRLVWHRDHSGRLPANCDICGGDISRPSPNRTQAAKDLQCTICNVGFDRSERLLAHAFKHTGKKPFDCPRCDQTFTRKSTARTHLSNHAVSRHGLELNTLDSD